MVFQRPPVGRTPSCAARTTFHRSPLLHCHCSFKRRHSSRSRHVRRLAGARTGASEALRTSRSSTILRTSGCGNQRMERAAVIARSRRDRRLDERTRAGESDAIREPSRPPSRPFTHVPAFGSHRGEARFGNSSLARLIWPGCSPGLRDLRSQRPELMPGKDLGDSKARIRRMATELAPARSDLVRAGFLAILLSRSPPRPGRWAFRPGTPRHRRRQAGDAQQLHTGGLAVRCRCGPAAQHLRPGGCAARTAGRPRYCRASLRAAWSASLREVFRHADQVAFSSASLWANAAPARCAIS